MKLLSVEEGDPVAVENDAGRSPVILICEHASRLVPQKLGTLGLSEEALESHIAWDPGALAVSRLMARSLDATLIHQRFSRLAYDCNRPPQSPDAVPETSEIYPIAGNANLSAELLRERAEALYFPFRERVAQLIRERVGAGRAPVVVTVHSFTPVYHGRVRTVEIGILYDEDSRLADLMMSAGEEAALYDIRRNEPYGPADGVTHTLKEHALSNGLLNVMIEVRNDLIRDDIGQRVVADYLTGLLLSSIPALSQR
ncbi:MAG: N-formylglutamate amidohydrolase [Shinella sp.]|nr:N-formylglutamate amidohydrolase [Shinella sp.]